MSAEDEGFLRVNLTISPELAKELDVKNSGELSHLALNLLVAYMRAKSASGTSEESSETHARAAKSFATHDDSA